MIRTCAIALATGTLLTVGLAQAADNPPVPPDNAEKLSQIIANIEKRDHFHYVKDVEWDQSGYYEITYFTTDKAKVEIKINPVSGKSVGPS